jgi:Flp pilus assembly CpaE family ATPase
VAARDCPRLLKRVKEAGPKDGVKVVVNRVGAAGHNDIKRADLEKALDAKVDVEIPQDQRSAAESNNAGKPMVVTVGKSKASAAIRELALEACGLGQVAKPPLWRRLLGRAA